MKLKDWQREQLIKIAKHHKKNCDAPDCGITLYSLYQIGEQAGIKWKDDDIQEFL